MEKITWKRNRFGALMMKLQMRFFSTCDAFLVRAQPAAFAAHWFVQKKSGKEDYEKKGRKKKFEILSLQPLNTIGGVCCSLRAAEIANV